LDIIKKYSAELAGVLVEPVQINLTAQMPADFLARLRKVTALAGIPLIFDEIITGFRVHQQGAQGLLGIQSDITIYGKSISAGFPIGIIAGKKIFMELPVANETVIQRLPITDKSLSVHPLSLAALDATLRFLKSAGPGFQENMNRQTKVMADDVNSFCTRNNLPVEMRIFGSIWKLHFTKQIGGLELLFPLMRSKGIFIQQKSSCFLNASFTDEDILFIIDIFRDCITEIIAAGIIQSSKQKTLPRLDQREAVTAPVPGARLGKDAKGNPAWFLPDPARPGKYLQIQISNKVIS
jgi:glutamate-1-semialdehyde aminotransferase